MNVDVANLNRSLVVKNTAYWPILDFTNDYRNLRGHREKGVKRSCKFFSKIWVGMFSKGQRIKRDTNSEDPEVRASDVFSIFLYFLQL